MKLDSFQTCRARKIGLRETTWTLTCGSGCRMGNTLSAAGGFTGEGSFQLRRPFFHAAQSAPE